ncbi:HHIP-like protein 2 [Holothuria leucospilota]|uniref:HHIP-like protein 2 n=1 Tax=Holothuria leucospilota TaxID=206669 RepID=A0A9Q1CAQ2_HOLLE|nr:HHIP-like protein 2 [Holothuria leucospilota]
MAFKGSLAFKTLLFSAILPSIRSHPQCTDSYPPFEEVNLQYCSQYREFGCCVAERDVELENLSRSILDNVPENVRQNCDRFVKDILCQECSPYAAHVFNMEGRSRADWSDFPGLCSEYCVNFHQTCGQLLPYITRSQVLLDASAVSSAAFCQAQMIDDVDYCFPDVLTNMDLNDEVRESQIGSTEDCLCLEEFANNLRNPLALTFANDGTHRIYVIEQTGVVTIFFRNGSYLSDPFLDIQDLVDVSDRTGDERGLLGIAFHPNYFDNFQFYVHYTTRIGFTLFVRISELKSFSHDSNIADVSSERVLIQVRQPAGNHNGGSLFFGLDGYLYISLGDGGIAGDPFGEYGNGLNLTTFLGKILRIDVNGRDGSLPYAIPPDNPFVGENPETIFHEIFAYGVRNMWRCSVDRGDPDTANGAGRIFCGDVGQNRFEEIDIILNGGNYGWRAMEGNSCFDTNLCSNEEFIGANYVAPIHVYNHTVGKSVTGGHVYRGCLYPNLQGLYIYGDFFNGRLFKLEENGTAWTNTEICLGTNDVCTGNLLNSFPQNILSFGEDESGEIYMLTTNLASSANPGGKIFRFVDPNRRGNPEECDVEERPVPVFGTISPNDNGAADGQYYGKFIGTLDTEQPSSQTAVGTVYAVDETQVFIRGFTFNGNSLGTDARFFAGSSDRPDATGVIIPDERGTTSSLGVYNNQNVLLTLPSGTTLSSLSWIAVWDVTTQSDYGRVLIPVRFEPPEPFDIGELGFVPRVHNVHADNVIIENSKQFTFVNLDYDGSGPEAYFWTGKGTPSVSGRRVADPNGNIERRLPSYRGATLTITLPEDLTVFDVDYIGIWCELFFQDFGNVPVRDEHRENIPPYIEVPDLAQGCVELLDNRYQVNWELRESDNRISIQLKGRVALNEYMAFGISGSETGTLMVGSDVSVVWIDPSTNEAQGEDYQLSAYSQCVVNSGTGACPDTFSNGDNNVEILSTEVQDGIIAITFERPLIPDDPLDKPIPTDRPVFISWSLGFINGIGLVSRHHTNTPGDLSIHFGNSELNCPDFTPLSDGPVLDPWVIDPLVTSGDDTFVAFIGPTGGLRGYQGLTGQIGWGIAWYINSSLIPEIYVHRGSTYRFEVYGGDEITNIASYHPLYITDSSEGGYEQKLPEEQAEEVIYAGPVEGSLCEYQNAFGINPDDFEDFYEYVETLSLVCPEDSEPGILEWTVAEDTPDIVYYQCYVHRYLGWKIHVLDAVFTTTEVTGVIAGIVFDCPDEASTTVSSEAESGIVFWTEPFSTNLQGPVTSFSTRGPGEIFPVGVTHVTYVFTSTINGDQAFCTFPVYVEQVQSVCDTSLCQNGGTCSPLGPENFFCVCPFPFMGPRCEQIQNACTPNPCQSGGSCTLNGASGFTCSCASGYIGVTCSQFLVQRVCDSSPCQNGGTCFPLGTTQFFCSCPSTFSGARCEQAQSGCDSSPCLNGGTCFPLGPTQFFCLCPIFFSGTTCELGTNINACTPNPCQNGGSCTLSGTNGFTCRCVTGFTGTICTQIQNACTPNPCQNGGSCTLSGTSGFTCRCVTGFTGTTCSQAQSGCDSSPCQNGGTCFSLGATQFFCRCSSTFSGTRCEEAQNACTPNPCQNGGSCTLSGTSGFLCRCATGFTGVTCSQAQRGCDSSPCQNGGTCFSLGPTQFFCSCPTTFSGTRCEQAQRGCDSSPCQNGGTCFSLGPTQFFCSCPATFSGTRCEQAQNACSSNPCQNGGSCTLSGTSGFICRCVTGFTGITCTQTQSGCVPNPCQNGGTCFSLGPTQFFCRCPSPFSGTRCEQVVVNTPPVITCPAPVALTSLANNIGNFASWNAPTCDDAEDGTITRSVCVPISGSFFGGVGVNTVTCTCTDSGGLSDECTFTVTIEAQNACTPNPCQNGGSCTLSGTSGFTCRCVTGFTGTICTQTQSGCDSSPCQNGGTCFPLGPTQIFCRCPSPFSGARCEQAQSGCDSSPCLNGGTCFPLGPTQFFCRCPAGFLGTRCEQVQNACSPNPCQNGGSCTLSGTSGFTCRCVTGFTGTTCTQIQNACTPNPCQNGGSCTLSGTSGFTCRCLTGFTGTICTQIQNACTPNPCQNGGSCTLTGTSGFTCRCVTGFTGTLCTQIQNACTPNPCQNGGSCTLSGTSGFTCRCVTGFTGTLCTQIQNACTPNPCQNGGSCTLSGTSGFTCRCVIGFIGATCTQSVLPVLEFSEREDEEQQSFSLSQTNAAIIRCTVMATDGSTPDITWYKGDSQLQNGDGGRRIFIARDGQFLVLLPPLNSEDAGQYRCEASIPSQPVSGSMEIAVTLTA